MCLAPSPAAFWPTARPASLSLWPKGVTRTGVICIEARASASLAPTMLMFRSGSGLYATKRATAALLNRDTLGVTVART